MATKTFSVRLPENNLAINFVPGDGEIPDLVNCAEELEKRTKNFLRLDKLIQTLEDQREQEKLAIVGLIGKRARYIHYPKRKRKIGIFYNRFSYDLVALQERLGEKNKDVFDKTVVRGVVIRLILPADEETKNDVSGMAIKFAERYKGKAEVYERLEPFVREDQLKQLASKRKIPLAGTRHPVINMRVYDESTRQSK